MQAHKNASNSEAKRIKITEKETPRMIFQKWHPGNHRLAESTLPKLIIAPKKYLESLMKQFVE